MSRARRAPAFRLAFQSPSLLSSCVTMGIDPAIHEIPANCSSPIARSAATAPTAPVSPRSWRHSHPADPNTSLPQPLLSCVLTLCLLTASACATTAQPPLEEFRFTRPEMGMPFRLVLHAADAETAETAALAAFDRIRQLNSILSDYDPDSELSLLSRTSGQGLAVPVTEDLWHVLNHAYTLSQETDGAFDVTIGPVVNVWRRARRDRAFPPPERLARARASVGYRQMKLDPETRTVELLVPDMRLDLGGIAKGYAIDQALQVLRQHGIRSALVTGGGDIAVSDPPPGRPAWRIELTTLENPNAAPPQHVLLSHRALATSGDLVQHLEIDGLRYSHIVDPRTGIGLTNRSLVTVIARDGLIADTLSTAASVLGPQNGLALLEQTPDVEARILWLGNQTVQVLETRGFQRYLEQP